MISGFFSSRTRVPAAAAPQYVQPGSCDVLIFNTQDLMPSARQSAGNVFDVTLARDSAADPFGVIVKECGQCGLHVQSIISGSVADKDGRIQPGDILLKLNDMCVRHWTSKDLAHGLKGLACKFMLRRTPDGACHDDTVVAVAPNCDSGIGSESLELWNALSFGDDYTSHASFLRDISESSYDSLLELEADSSEDEGTASSLPSSPRPSQASLSSGDSDSASAVESKHVIMRTSADQPLGLVIYKGLIVSVAEDSLAAAAGVHPRMRVVKVGHEPVPEGSSDRELVKRLRGKCGVFSIVTAPVQ